MLIPPAVVVRCGIDRIEPLFMDYAKPGADYRDRERGEDALPWRVRVQAGRGESMSEQSPERHGV